MTDRTARTAIVHFSATGTTAALAEAAAAGAREAGEVEIHAITAADIDGGRFVTEAALEMVDRADAVLFGSPTFMGGPAAQFKAFADASSERWEPQAWAGKAAAGFTAGNCPNGDQTHTLVYFTVLAAQHGMIWCGLDVPWGVDAGGINRLGVQTGLAAQPVDGGLPEEDLATARHLGRRTALLGGRLRMCP